MISLDWNEIPRLADVISKPGLSRGSSFLVSLKTDLQIRKREREYDIGKKFRYHFRENTFFLNKKFMNYLINY